MSNFFEGLTKGSHSHSPAQAFIMPTVLLSITTQNSGTLNLGGFWGINLEHYGEFSSLMLGFQPRRSAIFLRVAAGWRRWRVAVTDVLVLEVLWYIAVDGITAYLLWPLLPLFNNNLQLLASKNARKAGVGPLATGVDRPLPLGAEMRREQPPQPEPGMCSDEMIETVRFFCGDIYSD